MKFLKKILYRLTHNIAVNNLAILCGLETKLRSSTSMWKNFKVDKKKTLQENVGFSHRQDVEEALAKAHADLKNTVNKYVPPGGAILDIGCGTGLYLQDYASRALRLYGIDLSKEFLAEAARQLPEAEYFQGDFMKYNFNVAFDLIYSISVLEYIGRSELRAYFKKLANNLNAGGIIFIHYPHALCFTDTLYPDLNYIKYSPVVVEKVASEFFDIITHEHSYDGRKLTSYDDRPYPSVNGTFKNGYFLVARRSR